MDNVKSSRKRNHNINILNRIEIPEQYIEELQEKVKKENNLKYNQLKSLEEIRELYSKYGYILSEKQFVCLVLGVPDYNYYQLTNGTTKESYILVDNLERNYEEIRRKVIIENKLHYDDEINYNKLHNLHQKYEPKMREYIFADKILDINQRSLDNIRYDKKHKTHILLLEPLPSDDELLKLKENVISKYKLHRRNDIDYKRFKKIYNKFGGVMPEDMFAERILDVKKASLKKIKHNHNENTQVLLRTYIAPEKIKELKRKVRINSAIYPGKTMTYQEFEEIYNAYSHTLTKTEFSNIVLSIHTEKLRKLREKEISEVKVGEEKIKSDEQLLSNEMMDNIVMYVQDGLNLEQLAAALFVPLETAKKYWEQTSKEKRIAFSSLKKKRKKFFDLEKETLESLEERTLKILENYVYNSKNIEIVKAYIKKNIEEFEKGKIEITEDKLDILEDGIAFSQSGTKSIEFFTKVCIQFQEYERANKVINDNIDNNSVTKGERVVLRKLQSYLKHAISRKKALELLLNGETNIEELQALTGINELEAIKLKRNFLTNNISNLGIAFGE